MFKQFYSLFIFVFLMSSGVLNAACAAPKTDSLELWKADLPGKSPLLIANKEKISTIQGEFVLTTTQQIADINTGKVADFFVNLFQRSKKQENLYDH